jgi:peroxiredoxin
MYTDLASLARYGRVEVTLDDPKYALAVAQLDADDRQRAAAAFMLRDLRGQTWDSKKLRGKVVLVNFWSIGCGPCRDEMPDLEQLYRRFRAQGLVVLAISGDKPSDLANDTVTQRVSFPVLIDPDDKVRDQFRVVGIPKTFLYDREGHLAGQTLDRHRATESCWVALATIFDRCRSGADHFRVDGVKVGFLDFIPQSGLPDQLCPVTLFTRRYRKLLNFRVADSEVGHPGDGQAPERHFAALNRSCPGALMPSNVTARPRIRNRKGALCGQSLPVLPRRRGW